MHKAKFYYKIGEVCEITGLKPSIIRFWEKEFRQLKPVKFGSNHRYYTKNHLKTLQQIKELLYTEKMTIEGAKRKLDEDNLWSKNLNPAEDNIISEVRSELEKILDILKH
ncbi:regulatory protein MerR [Flexistipes sinusarabici DSM 4947]|uniref:Regulatory protein MerR n=2 Tax=Flexistipes sinusarabici TaxID=2352 RepID=F8E660_FLESM|nr:MerR family transcriptional regulator [Flexistipes sinusarabici]AEI14768.1 regulatory protein MerR [Flexistipes sinusarabici DSM 4947]HCW92346.1 MerR family transcriptional regulator [Flexistipes sinusarabici]